MRSQRNPRPLGLSVLFVSVVGVIFAFGLAIHLAPRAQAASAPIMDGPQPGKYIYDTTGLLTSAEIADLETHAKAVEQAGAPTIVYLQAKDATYDETYQDAGALMNTWNVESASDARDGFVMFLNLVPGNLRHGQVVLFAGRKYFQNGPLTHDETQRIYQDEMLPLLRDGDTAGAIAAGLDAVAHDLTYGSPASPKPSALQQAIGGIGALILAVLAILLALGAALVNSTMRGVLPQHRPALNPIESPPNDLASALVGALIIGRTHDAQMEATLLDFARRGLLAIEPVDISKLRLRLVSDGRELKGFEASLWQELAELASSDHIVLPSTLPVVRTQFARPLLALKQEMLDRGWYDREIGEKRKPYYWVGALAAIGVAVALLAALIAQQASPLAAAGIFLLVSLWAFIKGGSLANTSAEGEQVAAPWRDYRAGILLVHADPSRDADLSAALPYAVAMEIVSALDYRLQLASERGEVPAWFVRSLQPATTPAQRGTYTGFYPYWMAWHSTLYPAPSTTGGGYGGGFAGGGAAGGGGGGGGGF
jgi:uncharacterized membrane protein YgcG